MGTKSGGEKAHNMTGPSLHQELKIHLYYELESGHMTVT